MNNDLYYLTFSHFLAIGPVKFNKLKDYFGSIKNAYEANKRELEKVFVTNLAQKYCDFRSHFDPMKKYEEIKRKGICFISQEHARFPPQLRQMSDPPIGIYVKGDYQKFDFEKDILIAVVGTRKPTSYGQQIAKKLTSDLAVFGIVTVSGMAMGVDGLVHQATLDVQGKTIAVLGCGVDIIYPSIHRVLYSEIINDKSIVLSEFPPGQQVQPALFIQRNRIISGLSKGVLVIEGMRDSGTLITARFAAEQGKEVFAVPSPITSPLSEAPNLLIKQGAKLVTSVEDIIDELELKIEKQQEPSMKLDGKEKEIYETLKKEPKSADDLEMELHIPIHELSQILSVMEIKGKLEKTNDGTYQIR